MKKDEKTQKIEKKIRPPIVAVLGHVDHGKTTLLDFIRKSHVAEKEHGGITQNIGAYQITLSKSGQTNEKKITFIDTPGHEAFIKMRSRGATVADIALLVVAADDGVMPQTKESIKIIKKAKTPFIVVVNKVDLPGSTIDKIRADLARNEVQVEGFGGNVPVVAVSAKMGTGIPELLEKISSLWETMSQPYDVDAPTSAVVIESRLDKGKGPVAVVVIKKGTIHQGSILFDEKGSQTKIRAVFDQEGKPVQEAVPGQPVELIGFLKLPDVGTIFSENYVENQPASMATAETPQEDVTVADFLSAMDVKSKLKIIIKADTVGSLEAVVQSLGTDIDYVATGVGDFTEADVLLAKSTGAFVIGFQVKAKPPIEKFAQTEGVIIRSYSIIYDLLKELGEVIFGMQEVLVKERELGKGTIIAEFPFDNERIAGTKVVSGRLARGDQVKILRSEAEIGRGKIKSIRKSKDDVTKVEEGTECGVFFDKIIDFVLDDVIIAFTKT